MSSDWHPQTPGTFIQHLMEQGFSRHSPVITFEDFKVYELDMTRLKLNVGFFFPFVVPRQPPGSGRVTPPQVKQFWQFFEEQFRRHRKITVVLLGGRLDAADDDPDLAELAERGVVVWDQRAMQELADVVDHPTKLRLIGQKLVAVLGRVTLSPYVSGRPAIGGRFFGRSTYLRQILPDGSNCTVIGNRRVGKTSLLKEIKERLKLRGYRTAEVYGGTVGSNVDFVVQTLNELGEYRKAQQVLKNKYHVASLPRWIKQMAAKEPVAIFVDELDHILEFDALQNHELIHLLREIFESNSHCRVFFAGFRQVMKEKQSLGSPLFNFTRPVELQGFSREEAFEMVVKPLAHLGIDVTHTDLPRHIYATTAGQPEHIQIFCAELINLYESTGKMPDTVALVNRVRDSADYKQKVMGAFLSNTNPYEELLCYLLMAEAEHSGQHQWYDFGPVDVDRVLRTTGKVIPLRDIMSLLVNLMVSGVIQRVPGESIERYRFSSPMLMSYMSHLNLDFCIQKALDTIHKYDAYVYDTMRDEGDD
jgi:hypothetical protein